MKEIQIIKEEEFNELIIEKKETALVDFYAEWCGPCKMLAPILKEVSFEVENTKIYKVNIDDSFLLAKSFGVMSVPTLILFKNGEEVKRVIGLKNKDFIVDMLKD